MKHLVYISGPPCSGKTLLSRGILEAAPQFICIGGDRFWIENSGLEFSERVRVVNESILEFVRTRTESHLLLEWVPGTGSFPERLRGIGTAGGRTLSHIALYAPLSVLKSRKLARDGDGEIGPVDDRPAAMGEALVLDTVRLSVRKILSRSLEYLISAQAVQAV